MNITKDVIHDLFPLYLANECSADSRALVDEYLRANPKQAAELRSIMAMTLPRAATSGVESAEVGALREARRRVRRRSWTMGLAIFFTAAPCSFYYGDGKSWIMFRDAPKSALVYAILAVMAWGVYVAQRMKDREM